MIENLALLFFYVFFLQVNHDLMTEVTNFKY